MVHLIRVLIADDYARSRSGLRALLATWPKIEVVGEAVNYPLFFKVRKNVSQDSIHEISLEDSAIRYEDNQDNEDSETEEFL